MQQTFTLREAKARLSELLDLAASGVAIEITRQGAKKGRFKLVPSASGFEHRKPGALKGKITIPDGFDDEDEEILAEFENRL